MSFKTIFSVAFRMYDLDGDEKISKEELLAVLTMMVGANISEEQLMSIAERTIHEADEDKDTLISFDVRNSFSLFVRFYINTATILLLGILQSPRKDRRGAEDVYSLFKLS